MTSVLDHSADLVERISGPAESFRSWTEAVRRRVMRFEFDCDRPRAFTGILQHRSLGGVDFINMASRRHAAHRGAPQISAADSGFCVLTLQLAGQLRITQDDRTAVVRPGEYALYDSSQPVVLSGSDDYKSTCIRFPTSRLAMRGSEPLEGVTARAFDCAGGLPATVWDTLISLNRNLGQLGAHGPHAVRTTLELVGTMVREQVGAAAGPRPDLLERIADYIDEHLADPNLGPARIAAAHHISPRRLHQLFAPTGTSVARRIRARRIEMCRRDLADPALAGVPAFAIGSRWGFPGASHFGQVFKRETGCTPAEFREHALSSA